MQSNNIEDPYPQNSKTGNNPLSLGQFRALPYFNRYHDLLSEKQCRSKADKVWKLFKLAKVKKGAVLYLPDDIAENGYILLSGCVKLLSKKNNKEKMEMFPGHVLHLQEERQNYLYQHFKIPKHKAESLMHVFYEDKIQFKFHVFHTLYHNQHFGFGEMVRNTIRNQLAIATEQCEILYIAKNQFDEHLREFQVRKQFTLISNILKGQKQQQMEQIRHKMMQIMNTSILNLYNNDDPVYKEGEFVHGIYFIVEGEVQFRKKAVLNIPKKFWKSQNQSPVEKQTVIRVCKIGKGQFIGEEQIFSGRKFRSYSVISTLNNTLILKIDSNSFLKSLVDFPYYEQQLIENSTFKKENSDECFQKQFQKISISFLNQYEAYDSKKKERMLSDFINEDKKRTQQFQVYSPEGIFFRDTFQKLQVFQSQQSHPHKQSIKRFKQKSLTVSSPPQDPHLPSSSIAQKLLFSPKKNINASQLYNEALTSSPENNPLPSPSPLPSSGDLGQGAVSAMRYTKINKFEAIQKDQEVYKRVLIKNGMYPRENKIDKSRSAKPLIHRNFDQVVKQCISRKNRSVLKISKSQQKNAIIQDFQKTVKSIKNDTSTNADDLMKFSRLSFVQCKGTEQLKKRMKSIHAVTPNFKLQIGKRQSGGRIQDCVGFNQKPKSCQVPTRQRFDSLKHGSDNRNWGGKIVLLNHMMKPITYYHSYDR